MLAVIALGAPAGAQPTPRPLDAIAAEALRNNLGLAQENLAVERAAQGVRDARGRLLPALSLESRYSRQRGGLDLGTIVNPAYDALNQIMGETRFPTDLEITIPLRHESRVRLVQPLIEPAGHAAYRLSRRVHETQAWQRRAVARRTAAEAQTAYLDVLAARNAARAWEAALALATEGERVATRLVEAGRATPDAMYRARADRADVDQQLAAAREAASAAARAFNRILHRPLDTPIEEAPDSLLRCELTLTEDEAVERALARREEIAQTGSGIRAAEASAALAISSLLPSVAVALDYGFQGREVRFGSRDDFAVASLVLSWRPFSGGRELAQRAGAQLEAERLRVKQEEIRDLVRLDVRHAYQAAVVAHDAIATADARLSAARRTFDLMRRRYEEGLAAQIEFLDARTALTSAELNRVLTLHRFATRCVDLERAAALRSLD